MLTLQCIAAAMLVETGLSFFHSRVCIVSEISDQQSSLIMRRQRQSKSLGFSMQFDFAGREPAVPRSHDLRSGNGLPHRGSLKGRRRQRRQGTGPLRRGVLPSASASEGTTESATSSISATPVAQVCAVYDCIHLVTFEIWVLHLSAVLKSPHLQCFFDLCGFPAPADGRHIGPQMDSLFI